MKKNIIYLIILLILGVLVYVFVWKKGEGSYKASEKEFAVKDTNSISKILIADMRGEKIILEKSGDTWLVNHKVPASREAVASLLRTIAQVEVKVPVAKSMHNTAVKSMAGDNIKVELYDLDGKQMKSYYIGKPNNGYNGNFALMEGSDVPFILGIPGFEGFISTRFTTNLLDWKSRNVFSMTPEEIAEIQVVYPMQADSSFTITKNADNTYALENRTGYNPELTKYYAGQFKNINCESYIPDKYKLDSLLQSKPVCIITLKNQAGTLQSVKVYYRPVTYRTKLQFTYENKQLNFDLDKFYGVLHDDQDLILIQNFVFGKLFVGPQYFYREKPTNRNVLVDAVLIK